METTFYVNSPKIAAGITMKSDSRPEENNMALHACANPADVIRNREHLAELLHCEMGDLVCARQTHSANFHHVTRADRGRGSISADNAIPDTDALYTFEPNLVLCSFTADCVPVIFSNEASGLVGVIHSGWPGSTKEIAWKLFRHLIEKEHCSPKDFRIIIGPAISQEKFEVDEDVYEKFKALGYADDYICYNSRTNKYHIDNQLTVKKQIELAGIPADRIEVDRTCTYSSPDGFSYRENKKAGRHASFIMRKE